MAKAAKGPGDFPAEGDWQERHDWFEARLKGRSREDCIFLAGRKRPAIPTHRLCYEHGAAIRLLQGILFFICSKL